MADPEPRTGLDPEARIEQHLYEDETIQRTVDIGETRVVVTTNRVFTFQPDDDAAEYAERPNIQGVEPSATGSRSTLRGGIILIVTALPFVVGGWLLDGALVELPEFDEQSAKEIGAGGLADLVSWLLALVANLDIILLVTGVVLFGLAVLSLAWYWLVARTPTFAIRLAGDHVDLHIPRTNAREDAVAVLERAILAGETDFPELPEGKPPLPEGSADGGDTASGSVPLSTGETQTTEADEWSNPITDEDDDGADSPL
jgi:hypothetical protein